MTMTLSCDASAKPIGLIPVQEAVARLAGYMLDGKVPAQVLVSDEKRRFRSQHLDIAAPVIVMWPDYVELNPGEISRVSKRVMFARDRYTCQYCGLHAHPGRAAQELTMDHVKPAHLFPGRTEATTWDNVTTACRECNTRKGGKLPRDCKMMPNSVPQEPHYVQIRFAGRLNQVQRDYVCDYFGEEVGGRL